jgi:hypothetical protein
MTHRANWQPRRDSETSCPRAPETDAVANLARVVVQRQIRVLVAT